jgi:hypothetical protein
MKLLSQTSTKEVDAVFSIFVATVTSMCSLAVAYM